MKKALWVPFLAVAVYTVLVLRADLVRVGSALAAIDFRWMPLFLVLPLANYTLRFLKWHFLLGRIGVRLPLRESFQVFLAGFSMTVSPGHLGELVKCVFLKERRGVPVAETSPVVVAERVTDFLSMVLLAVGGMLLTGGRAALAAAGAGVAAAGLIILTLFCDPVWKPVSALFARLPVLRRKKPSLEAFRRSARTLLNPGSMLVAVPLGMVGWGLEAMVLSVIAASMGAGLPPGAALLSHAAGTIAGAVSMIPGGLGLAELTIDGILGTYIPPALATVTTLIMRFCTLWFGVLLGLAALASLRRRKCPAEPGPKDPCPPCSD